MPRLIRASTPAVIPSQPAAPPDAPHRPPRFLVRVLLGSFATVCLPDGMDEAPIIRRIGSLPGIELALNRAAGCSKFELPEDRLGDIIVVSERTTAIGSAATKHDLSGLTVPLRSHGGMTEQKVPVILNRKIKALPAGYRLRNFSAFDLALNYAVAQAPLSKAV